MLLVNYFEHNHPAVISYPAVIPYLVREPVNKSTYSTGSYDPVSKGT